MLFSQTQCQNFVDIAITLSATLSLLEVLDVPEFKRTDMFLKYSVQQFHSLSLVLCLPPVFAAVLKDFY